MGVLLPGVFYMNKILQKHMKGLWFIILNFTLVMLKRHSLLIENLQLVSEVGNNCFLEKSILQIEMIAVTPRVYGLLLLIQSEDE